MLYFFGKRRGEAKEYISKAEPMYRDYGKLVRQIKEKKAACRSLQKELAALSPLSVFKRSELKKHIAQLSEEIGELEFSKNEIVTGFGKEDEKEIRGVHHRQGRPHRERSVCYGDLRPDAGQCNAD